MHPSSDLTHATAAPGFPRVGASVIALALACWGVAILARATPDIIGHIAHPCGGCYISAFGPLLEPYNPPVKPSDETAATPMRSLAIAPTASIDGGDLLRMTLNESIANDRTFFIDGSPVARNFGTSLAVNLGGMTRAFHAVADEAAWTLDRLKPSETRADPGDEPQWAGAVSWNFAGSIQGELAGGLSVDSFAAGPLSGVMPLRDDFLGVAGGIGANRDMLDAAGGISAMPEPWTRVGVPYWHVAVQKDLQRHFPRIGAYGLNDAALNDGATNGGGMMGLGLIASGIRVPGIGALVMSALHRREGAISSAALPPDTTAGVAGTGIGASYQFIVDPGGPVSDALSAHAALLHDARVYDARTLVAGAAGLDSTNTFLADASWSFGGSVTSSIQYFKIAGSMDTPRYFSPGGSRNSAGVVAGVTYVPWGGAESSMQFLDLRIAAQYVAFTEFNGTVRGAGTNNGLFLSLWGALRF